MSEQTVNSTPFMNMGDNSHSGKKVSINAQDSIGEEIENLTSMMYKMSIPQEEGKNHLNLRSIQKVEEDKEDKILVGIEIMIGRDRILDRSRIDVEIATEEVTIDKILVETTIGIDIDKTLEETIVVTEVDQKKEALHPEGMVIGNITAQTQV